MATIIKPPAQLDQSDRYSVFLAGSIEMGAAEDWQKVVEDRLSDLDIVLYNPRRDDWDSTWSQRADNPPFREQVIWELTALRESDLIILYFSPPTMSPISLLELGLFADKDKLCVLCPDGFWRKGNVDIVCQMYGVPLFDDWDGLLRHVRVMATMTRGHRLAPPIKPDRETIYAACYVARCKCGCGGIIFAATDDPRMAADNVKEVAECIREGHTVGRTNANGNQYPASRDT